ncbi:hypothetical protein GALL_242960 [mine drainage metagenome]|uniref:Spore protein YkvP/CgeB glycosyl transferase-like domain-containing protein n=1 Tax=mine drainage metagenome TaxID=410659 RepID=A0A1J5RD42_9ZZZZ
MPAVKRVAIFTHPDTAMINMVLGLKTAFEAMGIEVISGFSYLDGHRMRVMVDMVRPDFILEINRSRNQIVDFDEKIHHIGWFEAPYHSGKRLDVTWGGSDMTYTNMDPAIMGLEPHQIPRWDYLHFAIDTEIYRPMGVAPVLDLSTIGYLAVPLQPQELEIVVESGGVRVSVREVAAVVQAAGLSETNFHTLKLRDCLEALFRSRNPAYRPDDMFWQLMTFVADRLFRAGGRGETLKKVLSVTRNVRLFGTGAWPADPVLSPYYAGRVFKPSEKAAVINLSRTVYHYGAVMMHERVLEAMACGVLPIMNRTPYDHEPFGICRHFAEGEHFLFYDENNIGEVLRALLADEPRRRRMGEQGRQRILERHTWRQRAEQILSDFQNR